ncbi:MAG: hypothetical protein ACRDFS_13010 [Chloroflexota bacterium]
MAPDEMALRNNAVSVHHLVLALVALALAFRASRRIVLETMRNVAISIVAILYLIALRTR